MIKRFTPGLRPAFGTGFLVSKDGLIYTNRHVIQPTKGLVEGTILLVGVPSAQNPESLDYFKAKVVESPKAPEHLDFAVLKIAAHKGYGSFFPLPTSLAPLELGSPVAVLGYPYIKESLSTLSFTKGSISATNVRLDGTSYYQTDAAVNAGNSGSPLLNGRGQAVAVVTLKKTDARNMGYALYLSEARESIESAGTRQEKALPEPGPIDPKHLPIPKVISPVLANWQVNEGETNVDRNGLTIDNDGDSYWITSKQPLPADFQMVIPCQVAFLQGKQRITPAQKDNLRLLCVRFATEKTHFEIVGRKGYLIEFSESRLQLWKEGNLLESERKGNPAEPFTLTVTKLGNQLIISKDDEILLWTREKKPLDCGTKFSIGGSLSRLRLGEVSVQKLEAEKTK